MGPFMHLSGLYWYAVRKENLIHTESTSCIFAMFTIYGKLKNANLLCTNVQNFRVQLWVVRKLPLCSGKLPNPTCLLIAHSP
jgi:hypothetical protein